MAYGTKTANIMDIPLSVSSVVAPYLGDNGYKFEGMNSIRVLDVANGSLANYDEAHATLPFGAPTLVAPAESVLTLAYNKSMLLRIQQTQIQDIPVGQFSKQVALQQADEVFVPAHDAYSIGKILAARPIGNKILFDGNSGSDDLKLQIARMVDKVKTGGGMLGKIVAWIAYDIGSQLGALINFTGSDAGYTQGKNGFIGRFAGVNWVETPDAYLGAGVYAIAADKRSIINVTPKMDPKGGGMTVLEKVPLFGGIEIQMRDRSDTFVLSRKARTVASLEAV